jgi:signal transduction histidine kinase
VRKHSHGKNVLVRIDARDDGGCRVTIEDDGRGFDFDGRLSAAELDGRRLGPAIIRERARLAKADLIIESTRGQGARLELTFDGTAS